MKFTRHVTLVALYVEACAAGKILSAGGWSSMSKECKAIKLELTNLLHRYEKQLLVDIDSEEPK